MYPLMSSKMADFDRFARICELVSEDEHLERDGFETIVRLAMEMNPSGKRKYIGSDILESLRSGERIVCAAGNRGVHGWRHRLSKPAQIGGTPPASVQGAAGNTEGKNIEIRCSL
jgi:hypothetical protein